jgi:spore maturation protein CgeB
VRILFLESSSIWFHTLPLGFRDLGHNVKATGPLTEQNISQHIKAFKPNLIVSSNPDETKNRVRYFLKRPELREKIRSAGMEAVKVHSYKHRAAYVIQALQKHNILNPRRGARYESD